MLIDCHHGKYHFVSEKVRFCHRLRGNAE